VHGHDVKSIARQLSISTSAANERLRSARQKLGVSSSREAARVLAAAEGDPSFPVDREKGLPIAGVRSEPPRSVFVWIGVVMSVAIATTTIALTAVFGGRGANAGPPVGPPRVVSTSPSAGAVIAPGAFTLSVTFDQPMLDGSMSYVHKAIETNLDCAFPAHLSKDGRTFTVGCKVEPSHHYEIWFNSPPYMNFKSINGVPAEPYQLLFRTKAR
jgi:hypothetical protein